MVTFLPPKEVFEVPPEDPRTRLARMGYNLTNFKQLVRSSEGEMLAYYEQHPVPRKGMPYFEAIQTGNEVKRIALTMFSPFADLRHGLTAFLESYLYNFCRVCDSIYLSVERVPYLKREYYCSTSKGLWDLVSRFLMGIGISEGVANQAGKIAATIFEYDDAYRMPVVDIMSEFTKEEILKSPIKFVRKFIAILSKRSDNNDLIGKFEKFSFLLRIALWFPRYRRAFRQAFEKVDFNLLQYDQFDAYWSLNRGGYDSFGKPLEERMGKMQELMDQYNNKSNAV